MYNACQFLPTIVTPMTTVVLDIYVKTTDVLMLAELITLAPMIKTVSTKDARIPAASLILVDHELPVILMIINQYVLVSLDILVIRIEAASLQNLNQLLVVLKILNAQLDIFVNHQNALRDAEVTTSVIQRLLVSDEGVKAFVINQVSVELMLSV